MVATKSPKVSAVKAVVSGRVEEFDASSLGSCETPIKNPPKKLPIFEKECWCAAIEKYNSGPGSKHPIDSRTSKSGILEVQALLKSATTTLDRFERRKSGFRYLRPAVELLRSHSGSLDILSQTQPELLSAVLNETEEACRIAIEGIHQLLRNFGRWEIIESIYPRDQRVRPAVIELYVAVLELLLSAERYLNTNLWKRIEMDKAGVLQWLDLICLTFSNCSFPQHSEGTGEWLYSLQQYAVWYDQGKQPLAILGGHGHGKSGLASMVVARLRERTHHVIFCTFQARTEPRRSNPSMFVASVLYQLLQLPDGYLQDDIKRLLAHLEKLRIKFRAGPQNCRFQDLWGICLEALGLLQKRTRLFLIIDALDECRFGDDYLTLQTFLEQLKLILPIESLRLAIFSRPQLELDSFLSPEGCIFMHHDLLKDDIRRFAGNKLPHLKNVPIQYRENQEKRHAILDKIALEADGNFLWAHLYLEWLNTACNLRRFELKLQESFLPKLYGIYATLLRESPSSTGKDAKDILQRLVTLAYEAQEPLPLRGIACILDLLHTDFQTNIIAIARPFFSVTFERIPKLAFSHLSAKEYLEYQCQRPNPLVSFKPSESHAQLAMECIRTLLELQYGSKDRIGNLLHHNYRLGEAQSDSTKQPNCRLPYEYAHRYWDFHLFAVSHPEPPLSRLVHSLLHAPQFVYWSEYTWQQSGETLARIQAVKVDLLQWHDCLPEETKELIDVSDYFVLPYQKLSETYKEHQEEDKVLQWLTLERLGTFLLDSSKGEEALLIFDKVVRGLRANLGDKNPLTLKAMTSQAELYLVQGKFELAQKEFSMLAGLQEEVLGKDDPVYYITILSLGTAELFMTQYEDCLPNFHTAEEGFSRILGQDSSRGQSAEIGISFTLVQEGHLPEAYGILSSISKKRRDKYGDNDVVAATAQFTMGDIERKQGIAEKSLANLQHGIAVRRRVYPPKEVGILDWTIALLVAFRDFGMREDAEKLLENIDRDSDVELFVDRQCQVTHIRALLAVDGGKRDEGIRLLESLLVRLDRDLYNRPLMWVLLDLATLLRARDREGDKEHARSIFDHILVDLHEDCEIQVSRWLQTTSSMGDDHEPDPPRLLELAEKALCLLRFRDFDKLKKLFREEQVYWAREKDLWLVFGYPAADTAWMKPPLG
ncbi:hypothetical protein GQ53DRAFT_832806 [Thozetella sp. PMI_491]|nr:hypothetical protein GQ53DRAFT_832806 [Thozetella sp. PMI_491]